MCCSLQPSEVSLASWQASHACLPSHYDSAAPGFLPEWRQDVAGPERVHGGSRSAPGWEALGGVPDQALSSSIAVTVEPLTNDHPHQRPSLSYDHISCDGQWFLFVYESLTSDHPSYTTTPMWFWGWSYKRGSTVLHAQRNGDFLFQHVSLETMMPYYFAASTWTTPPTWPGIWGTLRTCQDRPQLDCRVVAEALAPSQCEVNWNLQHRQWAGRANKSKRQRCIAHRQHSKRDVRRPLSGAFHSKIEVNVKTMQEMMK